MDLPTDAMKPEADATTAAVLDDGLAVAPSSLDAGQYTHPLFDEFYDDWSSFDAAIARATAAHHPIRKRSSLTFEVYNRTVSKGRHDRKSIADFLSKTFKCTHGIKFRSRGSGKRMRHKLRDIGCPFHVYASAVEFGSTYRVKVRMHDKHNHPIGPDSMKMMSGTLHESDYELATTQSRPVEESAVDAGNAAENVIRTDAADEAAAHAACETELRHQMADAEAREAQTQAQAEADARTQVYTEYDEAEELLDGQGEKEAEAGANGTTMTDGPEQSQGPTTDVESQPPSSDVVDASDILSGSGHDSEALLDGAMEDDDVFAASVAAPTMTSDGAAVAVCSTTEAVEFDAGQTSPAKFEPTMTLEGLRKRIAEFADERDWNQFHTPRNLLLALTGEVGELCEIFQWKGEVENTEDWSARDKEHLGEEISDVLIYLVRLADKCDVNLPAALSDKIAKNAQKYPAELVRGSSKKYNEYKRMRISEESTL
uniref:dCTP pyrophosphatase 1 n=1 Tax=Peronospora matthiolae TaxID=2874970 RepID=A0AAV1UXX2_9STRA